MMFLSSHCLSQYFNGDSKVLRKDQITYDSIALVTWPSQIPDQAFHAFPILALHDDAERVGGSFIIPIGRTMNPQNRSHVAVYYSSVDDLRQAVLYRHGLGVAQLKIPLGRPGYYYAVIIGPLGDFVQLYHYDGSRVVCSKKVHKDMAISSSLETF